MYHKSKVFRMHQRERAIAKKKKIAKAVYGSDFYVHEGQYNKGKIHCSCPLCAYHADQDIRFKKEQEMIQREIREIV